MKDCLKTIMYCPKCGTVLSKFAQGKYETLDDHVSDPSGEYELPERPMYTCINGCLPEASFYGMFGGWYSGRTKREAELAKAWIINKGGPLDDYFYLLLRNEENERYISWGQDYWQLEYKFE